MARNKLSDLQDHLFAQIERLRDEHLTPEEVAIEVARAGAIVDVADQISGNYDLQLRAARLFAEHGDKMLPYLPQIGAAKDKGTPA